MVIKLQWQMQKQVTLRRRDRNRISLFSLLRFQCLALEPLANLAFTYRGQRSIRIAGVLFIKNSNYSARKMHLMSFFA